jgi:hypothetical protein
MPPDLRRLTRPLAVSLAAAVLAAGCLYTAVRPVTYESRAELAVVPSGGEASVGGTAQAAAATRTYAELLRSDDTLSQAGSPPVRLRVLLKADDRVLALRATGRSKQVLRPALAAIVAIGRRRQAGLGEPWGLRTIQSPTAPIRLGASAPATLGASLLLALLAPLLVLTATGRPSAPPEERQALRHETRPRAAAARLERRSWRYPTRM